MGLPDGGEPVRRQGEFSAIEMQSSNPVGRFVTGLGMKISSGDAAESRQIASARRLREELAGEASVLHSVLFQYICRSGSAQPLRFVAHRHPMGR